MIAIYFIYLPPIVSVIVGIIAAVRVLGFKI